VQAVAAGVLEGVSDGRRLVERAMPIDAIRPETTLDWDALAGRLDGGQ
jgi:hypothetical protein